MLSRFYILISIFSVSLVFAQSPGSSSNSSARKEPQSAQGSEMVIPSAPKGNFAKQEFILEINYFVNNSPNFCLHIPFL